MNHLQAVRSDSRGDVQQSFQYIYIIAKHSERSKHFATVSWRFTQHALGLLNSIPCIYLSVRHVHKQPPASPRVSTSSLSMQPYPAPHLHDPQPHHLNLLASLSDSSRHRISSSRTTNHPFISHCLTTQIQHPTIKPPPHHTRERGEQNENRKRKESLLTSALDVPNNRPRRIIPFHSISKKISLDF